MPIETGTGVVVSDVQAAIQATRQRNLAKQVEILEGLGRDDKPADATEQPDYH